MRGKIKIYVAAAVCLGLALPAAAQAAPAPVCLYAFSKDFCSAKLFDGDWGIPFCTTGGTGCNNLVGNGATFRGAITPSNGKCGEDPTNLVPCDEAPDLFGELIANVNVRTQRHTPCKARGSWEGTFSLVNSLGITYATGNLAATMGMGTHREACDDATCSQDCETCHDARVISQSFDWQIGAEGTLLGTVSAGTYAGCRLIASFQGDFTANGDSRGPQVPNPSWGFCGTMEGALHCPCPP